MQPCTFGNEPRERQKQLREIQDTSVKQRKK